LRNLWFLACLFLNCSCAIHYTDDQGNKRILGLVDVVLPKSAATSPEAGEVVKVTNVGILISKGPLHSGVSVGYNSETSVILKDNTAAMLRFHDDQTSKKQGEL
jgi:hypothetical protein